MSEAFMIATPIATGIAFATPKPSPSASLLLALLSTGSGILGLQLAREGKIEATQTTNILSIIFGISSILKALELI